MLPAFVIIFVGLLGMAVIGVSSGPKRTDEELMLLYREGDLSSFEELYRRHCKGVFNFLLRYLGDRLRAEEATQEVFVRVVRRAASYQKQARFSTWLYTIARNLTIDMHRRKKVRQHVSLSQPVRKDEDQMTLEGLLEDKHFESDGERGTARGEIREAVRGAIDDLPDEQRQVFLLREYSGMPFKEIASVVGCPENTAKSRMRYALEHMRNFLSQAGFTAQDAL